MLGPEAFHHFTRKSAMGMVGTTGFEPAKQIIVRNMRFYW